MRDDGKKSYSLFLTPDEKQELLKISVCLGYRNLPDALRALASGDLQLRKSE